MKKTWSSERLNSLPKVSQQAEELGLEPQVCLTLASQAHVMFWYPVRSVTVMAPVQTCSCAFCASGALGTQCVCTLGFVITRSSLPCESSHAHLPDLALVLPAPSLPPSFLPSQQSVLFLTALSPPASVSNFLPVSCPSHSDTDCEHSPAFFHSLSDHFSQLSCPSVLASHPPC